MISLDINPRKYVAFGVSAALVFLVAGIIAEQWYSVSPENSLAFNLRQYLTLRKEQTIPTWFASLQLVFAAFLFISVGLQQRRATGRLNMWFVAGLVFTFLSMDEAVSFHERLNDPTREALGIESDIFYAWVIPVIAITFIGFAVMLRWWLALPAATRKAVALGTAIYIIGAAGFEIAGNSVYRLEEPQDISYIFVSGIEEILEMLGVTVIVYALLAFTRAEPVRDEATSPALMQTDPHAPVNA